MSYDDTNDRDIRAKQESEPAASQSVTSSNEEKSGTQSASQSTTGEAASADADDVRVLPGTGGLMTWATWTLTPVSST
jgi:hypothetical protein